MATLPLDLDDVLGELRGAAPNGAGMAAQTRIGHVHLNVAGLDDAERFYCDEIGFEVSVRGYPGALFVAAGGYHHHIGLNTWNGPGAPPPPKGSIGLDHFEVVAPGIDAFEAVDPSAITVVVRDARPPAK
jgi:catechol 2,3-dioxygenase